MSHTTKMQPQREYTILPQDSENFSRIRREEDYDEYEYKKPFCFYCVLVSITLLIFGACATFITASQWSDEFNASITNIFASTNWTFLDQTTMTTVNPNFTTAIVDPNITLAAGNSSTGNMTTTVHPILMANETDGSGSEGINENNVGEKFSEAMRQLEKEMERLSGIHQAELVVPLFMLIVLMSTLALISLCCCVMSKQREKRQRKLLGKFITDLQTGDRTMLLNNKDDDL